ncbi:MAG TPA: bifunctional YncE family protein/alkaline phosphatase family protein [Thermoanaerobaculia bacterium]|jgi:YVTN family beta-propeller protein|nr:bifunctional YncE family protein/alkaline phosphatase family protein [Thermoanaerobaculia bacterium]
MRIRCLIIISAIAANLHAADLVRLPTGVSLDPAAESHAVGNFPLAIAVAPGGERVALLLNGWRQQGLQIVDRKSGAVTQTLPQTAAFVGLAFSNDGKTLYASGGNDDSIFVYRWNGTEATADGKIDLVERPKPVPNAKPKDPEGIVYPAGIATSHDGRFLYVAENLGDSLAVLELSKKRVIQRVITDRYPYTVVVDAHGDLYVSAWGDNTVDRFRANANGTLRRTARIVVGRHPSAMVIRGTRLYVASASTDSISVVDTTTSKVVHTLHDAPPAGPREGSTPNALVLSRDGSRLFVAEADNNAVGVFAVATGTLLGRVPVEWYPSALTLAGDDLIVVNGKGRGTQANPNRAQPGKKLPPDSRDYTLGQLDGSLISITAGVTTSKLASFTKRVANANGWNTTRGASRYPPFKHVIYIIKENRTYDQVLGDMKEGDGDASLVFFPENVSPNHHALARRFGLFDRFFVNAEVSAQGHNWSTGAYATDYLEKTMPAVYSSRGRTYDYEGTNRDRVVDDDDDANAPANGYLWDLAVRKKISLRNYGEFAGDSDDVHDGVAKEAVGLRRALRDTTSPDYPPFDMGIPDQTRADAWLREFNRYVERGSLPALEILRLPNDHTEGAAAGKPTPRAFMADNDLAVGRIVDAVSHSPNWRDTAIFIIEDDAQSGPDHVDSHRSVLLMISAWNRGGLVHRFVNTTDVLATMEEILGLDSLSQFDHYGRPMRGLFAEQPDLTPYDAIKPGVALDEKNPESAVAKQSALLDFSKPDKIDDHTLNLILWRTIKGDVPYPGPTRAAVGQMLR